MSPVERIQGTVDVVTARWLRIYSRALGGYAHAWLTEWHGGGAPFPGETVSFVVVREARGSRALDVRP
jgi:hypothetical protein